jgi:NADH-quinone oxidoreductase subunit M
VLAPLAGAALVWLLPRGLARGVALVASAVPAALGAVALFLFKNAPGADYRWGEYAVWNADWGVAWNLGIDGLGAALLALSGLIGLIATISAWNEDRHPRAYHACVLLLLCGIDLVFATHDLLLFYIGWELVLVPMWLLIGIWGGAQRRYAALKFFIVTLAGSVLMLAAILGMWVRTPAGGRVVAVPQAEIAAYSTDGGATVHGLAVQRGLDPDAKATVVVPRGFDLRHLKLQWQSWEDERFAGLSLAAFAFVAFALAFAVKVPLLPLHTWLPHAHVQAPTAISVILAGVLLKLGVYGFARIAWPLFPVQAQAWAPTLAGIGTAGILWAAWVALAQNDLKRLVAYSSVSHMGYCLLGLACGSVTGITGGLVQAITHGIGSALLFLLVGVIYDRAHHRRIDGFGGLAGPMPLYAAVLLVGCLAAAGLPGLAGFPGELLAVLGAFAAGRDADGGWWYQGLAVLACLAVILSAAYLLLVVKRVAYGPIRDPEHTNYPDLTLRELCAIAPLVCLTVALGLVPQPLISALRPAAEALAAHMAGATP